MPHTHTHTHTHGKREYYRLISPSEHTSLIKWWHLGTILIKNKQLTKLIYFLLYNKLIYDVENNNEKLVRDILNKIIKWWKPWKSRSKFHIQFGCQDLMIQIYQWIQKLTIQKLTTLERLHTIIHICHSCYISWVFCNRIEKVAFLVSCPLVCSSSWIPTTSTRT